MSFSPSPVSQAGARTSQPHPLRVTGSGTVIRARRKAQAMRHFPSVSAWALRWSRGIRVTKICLCWLRRCLLLGNPGPSYQLLKVGIPATDPGSWSRLGGSQSLGHGKACVWACPFLRLGWKSGYCHRSPFLVLSDIEFSDVTKSHHLEYAFSLSSFEEENTGSDLDLWRLDQSRSGTSAVGRASRAQAPPTAPSHTVNLGAGDAGISRAFPAPGLIGSSAQTPGAGFNPLQAPIYEPPNPSTTPGTLAHQDRSCYL